LVSHQVKEIREVYILTKKGFHISSNASGACNIIRKIADTMSFDLSAITVKFCQFLERIYIYQRPKVPNAQAEFFGIKGLLI
jgi:putative transposase